MSRNLLDPTRREAAGLLAAAAAAGRPGVDPGGPMPRLTCVIRYQIDPFQREAFRVYAEAWGRIIPRCGGHLLGYFLPDEGTNDIALALIAFDSLAAYESYRARLKVDPDGRANFQMAQDRRLILREERTFLETVAGTFQLAPAR